MFTKLCRIGNDPELRFTKDGIAVCGLSLAYHYGKKGSDGKKPTQWIEASLWGKQAEALHPYLIKGHQVVVSVDDLHIETYQKKDGGEGIKLVGRIVFIDLVGSKAEAKELVPSEPSKKIAGAFDNFDDDIPF